MSNKCDVIHCEVEAPQNWAYCDEHYRILYGEDCAPILTMNQLQSDLQRHKDALGRVGEMAVLADAEITELGKWSALNHTDDLVRMFTDSGNYIWPVEE